MSDNMQRRRDRVMEALTAAPWPLTSKEVAQRLERPHGTVRADLNALTDAGLAERAGVSVSGAQCWRAKALDRAMTARGTT